MKKSNNEEKNQPQPDIAAMITTIATSHQRRMNSVHPSAIIETIEEAIKVAMANKTLHDHFKPAVKPPSGVLPKRIIQEQRFESLSQAIAGYTMLNRRLPVEWVDEYNELEKELSLPRECIRKPLQ